MMKDCKCLAGSRPLLWLVGGGVWLSSLLMGCQNDSYDKGEGQLSLTRADFVVAYTDHDKRVARVVTDDGDTLTLRERPTARWITTPDSLYRAVLYYNKAEGDDAVDCVALSFVSTLAPLPFTAFKEGIKTDPVVFESVWVSRNGSYLNMGLYLKGGKAEADEASHVIGMAMQMHRDPSGAPPIAYLQLYHDQGGVPEYYSSKCYISIPCSKIGADSVRVTINTYDGPVVKGIRIRK